MGLIMPEELQKMIPILEENISLAKSILEKNPEDEDLKRLLQSQKNTLKEYKKRLNI